MAHFGGISSQWIGGMSVLGCGMASFNYILSPSDPCNVSLTTPNDANLEFHSREQGIQLVQHVLSVGPMYVRGLSYVRTPAIKSYSTALNIPTAKLLGNKNSLTGEYDAIFTLQNASGNTIFTVWNNWSTLSGLIPFKLVFCSHAMTRVDYFDTETIDGNIVRVAMDAYLSAMPGLFNALNINFEQVNQNNLTLKTSEPCDYVETEWDVLD